MSLGRLAGTCQSKVTTADRPGWRSPTGAAGPTGCQAEPGGGSASPVSQEPAGTSAGRRQAGAAMTRTRTPVRGPVPRWWTWTCTRAGRPGSTRPPSSGSPVASGQRSSSNSTGSTGAVRGRGGTSSLMSGHSHHGPPGRGRAAGERPERRAGVASAGADPSSRASSHTPRPSRPARSSRSGPRTARASTGAFGSPPPSGRHPAPSPSSDHHTPASVAANTLPGRPGSGTTAFTGTPGSPSPCSTQVTPPSSDRHTHPPRRSADGGVDQAAQATQGRAGSVATLATRPGRGWEAAVTVQVPVVRSSWSSSPSAVPASRRSGPVATSAVTGPRTPAQLDGGPGRPAVGGHGQAGRAGGDQLAAGGDRRVARPDGAPYLAAFVAQGPELAGGGEQPGRVVGQVADLGHGEAGGE